MRETVPPPPPHVLAYFARPNASTAAPELGWLCAGLGDALEAAIARVKAVLVHPVDARRAGARARRGRRSLGLDLALHTTVGSILGDDRLAAARRRTPDQIPAAERLVLSCDHHALLFTGMLRHRGLAVRTRAGRARYIVRGLEVPHWICEVWDGTAGRWRLVDPERRRTDVPGGGFVPAGETWLACRRGRRPARLSSWSGYPGLTGARYAVLCDATALLKNELVGYEWRVKSFGRPKPELVRRGVERLADGELRLLDRIAELSLEPDAHLAELWELVLRAVPRVSLRVDEPPPGAPARAG